MNKTVLIVLLLAVGSFAYNVGQGCSATWCKPAVKVQSCIQAYCYRCGVNEVLNQDTYYCDCKAGYLPINGVCGKCAEGYQYDSVMQQCIGINPCGINQYLVNGVCKCLPGLIVIQNICQRCPTNQTYFAQYDACRCSTGFTLLNGNCVLINCVVNEVYSADAQACVCASGYFRINGVCGQCLMNQVYNSATQTCNTIVPPNCGFNEYWYENCCFCEIGYVRISGTCISCPEHSSYDWNTDSCVCDAGYYFVGETVAQIPYQYYDTGSSYTSNPSYSYSYKAPYSGVAATEPIIVVGSNYDASNINTNSPNINNIYNPPASR